MEFMTAGFEIPVKKKSDDVMFDVSLHGNPFNFVPAMCTSCRLFCITRRLSRGNLSSFFCWCSYSQKNF